jgi:hypothetical protein
MCYRTERVTRQIAVLPGILISIFAWNTYQSLKNVEVKELMQLIFARESSYMITCMKMKLVQKVSESTMLPTSEVSDMAVPCILLHFCLSRGQSYNTQTVGRLVLVPPPPLCLRLYRSPSASLMEGWTPSDWLTFFFSFACVLLLVSSYLLCFVCKWQALGYIHRVQ